MIKYILVSLLIAYLIRKIFPPIIYHQPPRDFYDKQQSQREQYQNQASTKSQSVTKKKAEDTDYVDYEEIKD
jgi:hypothetical protein